MKKFWAVILAGALAAGFFLFFKNKNSAPPRETANPVLENGNSNSVLSETKPVSPNSGNGRAENDSPVPAASNVFTSALATNQLPPLEPLTILDKARVAIKNYQNVFGENPVGTNPEITEALLGKNPKQINFIADESALRVNAAGEMIDAYGTPFFFHQLSSKEMEIHSAGQDRKLWTLDDQVVR